MKSIVPIILCLIFFADLPSGKPIKQASQVVPNQSKRTEKQQQDVLAGEKSTVKKKDEGEDNTNTVVDDIQKLINELSKKDNENSKKEVDTSDKKEVKQQQQDKQQTQNNEVRMKEIFNFAFVLYV